MENRERYRKMPGHRRGFLFGSSVWLGSDHLLLVKSARFREEYKRFYFRDIQAIVVAKARRIHVSTRSAPILLLWFATLGLGRYGAGWSWAHGLVGVLLVNAWFYVSIMRSCRCRILTAVSSDELPSLYRTWTARRFLSKVEPYLAQTQSVIEGDWVEAVEEKQVGPLPEGRIGLSMPGAAAPFASPPPPGMATRAPVSILFVASLCLGGLADLLTLGVNANVGRWVLLGFILLQLAAAVAVLVQNFVSNLRQSMRNLAIVTLASIGIWYYAVQLGAGMAIGYQNARSKNPQVVPAQMQPMGLVNYPLSRGIAGGMDLLLGIAGVALLLLGERQPEEKVSFNV